MAQATSEEEPLGAVTAHAEFVPVAFAVDRAAADDLVALLERHHVPALLDEDATNELQRCELSRGVAVLVPEQMHDAATELVARDDADAAEEEEELFEDDDADDDADDEDFDDEDLDDLDDLDDDYEDDDDFDEDTDDADGQD